MNAERLLEHYEKIAEAPDAIARLRRFILDLAVRGKLVPQDPQDECAAELLHRIAAEKVRLVRAGEIRQPKAVEPLDSDQLPFSVPKGWSWTQIAHLGVLAPRNEAPDDHKASFVPMPMIFAEYGVTNDHEARSWGEIKKGYTHFAEGDVGLAKITPCFENGKSTVFRNLTGGIGSGTTELHVVRPLFVNADYVVLFLKSPLFLETGIPRMTGTAGQKRVPTEYFTSSPFSLPPLAEQHRIVAKVDELMALCDQLEQSRAAREGTRDRLTAASLIRLNDPAPETFQTDAHFVLDALPSMTARPDQIKPLRQTILNLAVRGKLTPQDPMDAPASALLTQKWELPGDYQRRRKVLKESPLASSHEMPVGTPRSWLQATIQELYDCNIIFDYADGNHGALYPRSNQFGEVGVTFVSAKNIENGRVDWTTCAKLNSEWAQKLKKGWSQGGDVLLTHNATVGRVALVEEDTPRFLLGTSVTYYRLHQQALLSKFFFYFLQSPLWQRQLEAIMAQTTRNQVSIQKQAFFSISIPPYAEQKRIVAKVEELMGICDHLEASLTAGETVRSRLLDALLHEALQPSVDRLEAAA